MRADLHDHLVKYLTRLNLAQRIVIVIAFGIAMVLFGDRVTALGAPSFGWVAYAPLSAATFSHRAGLTFGEIILIWIGLTARPVGASVGRGAAIAQVGVGPRVGGWRIRVSVGRSGCILVASGWLPPEYRLCVA